MCDSYIHSVWVWTTSITTANKNSRQTSHMTYFKLHPLPLQRLKSERKHYTCIYALETNLIGSKLFGLYFGNQMVCTLLFVFNITNNYCIIVYLNTSHVLYMTIWLYTLYMTIHMTIWLYNIWLYTLWFVWIHYDFRPKSNQYSNY